MPYGFTPHAHISPVTSPFTLYITVTTATRFLYATRYLLYILPFISPP